MATDCPNTDLSVLHSPEDDITSAYLAFIGKAQKSLHICIYGFHLPALRDALIAAAERGLTVSVILDHTQAAGHAEKPDVDALVAAKVPIAIGTSAKAHEIIHDKFTVVDGHLVEFGSWNYSLSATEEDNTACFADNTALAKWFLSMHNDILRYIRRAERQMQPAGETPALAAAPDGSADPTLVLTLHEARTLRFPNANAAAPALSALYMPLHHTGPAPVHISLAPMR